MHPRSTFCAAGCAPPANSKFENCVFFFFKQKTAYEISACLVGSEMCIRDRARTEIWKLEKREKLTQHAAEICRKWFDVYSKKNFEIEMTVSVPKISVCCKIAVTDQNHIIIAACFAWD